MSREIKFKGWNTESKIMYSAEELGEDELTINSDGRGFVNVNGISQKLSQYMQHIIPLQFTGLHDENGVEIYEDDICKSSNMYPSKVCFINGGFSFNNDDSFSEHYNYYENDDVRVIGNIHENPELLETTK